MLPTGVSDHRGFREYTPTREVAVHRFDTEISGYLSGSGARAPHYIFATISIVPTSPSDRQAITTVREKTASYAIVRGNPATEPVQRCGPRTKSR